MKIARVALDVPLARLFDYALDEHTEVRPGQRVMVPFGSGKAPRLLLAVVFATGVAPAVEKEKLKPVHKVLNDVPALGADWLKLMEFCASYYQKPIGEAVFSALPPGLRRERRVPGEPGILRPARDINLIMRELPATAKRKRGVLQVFLQGPLDETQMAGMSRADRTALRGLLNDGTLVRASESVSHPRFVRSHELNSEQAHAVEAICANLEEFSVHVLFGITGSGKTEIYLNVINEVLSRGRQVLVLVPEIALTPALEEAFTRRFPGACIVMQHSGMPEQARTRAWLDAHSGRANIILGTRLAALMPLDRAGVIVVDEEQDASFKQQDGLRYSARDVAIYRASIGRHPVLLVSATPSMETYHRGLGGRYRLHTLTARAHAEAKLPAVHLVDTTRHATDHGLTEPVVHALQTRLDRQEQSLVFLNRRGYAPVLSCPACGWISDCVDCAAHLVVHLGDKRLRCHHCGFAQPIPAACPVCHNIDLQPLGRGTQRLEETLAARFPQARILRVDGDTTRRRGSLQAMLDQVHGGQADILLGTQILAKGHHFPGLTLVVVLNADAGLFAADYRASEKLFSQLEQVSGRAGRAGLPGEVWIQTRFPKHPLYQSLVAHDYAGFAKTLLAEREEAGFPPFVHEAALRAEATAMDKAEAFLQQAIFLAPEERSGITLFRPVPLSLPRLARMERAQVILQSASRPRLQAFLTEWSSSLQQARVRDVRWHIDVDPTEF